jgi:hypothetical protein
MTKIAGEIDSTRDPRATGIGFSTTRRCNRRFLVALISVGPARTLAQNLLLILGNRAVVSSFPNEWFTRATQLSNVSTRWMAGRFPPLILLVPAI